jgi:AcrR family transcriptional regulator
MAHIAEASGCRKGTLYHRFASKEDVLIALAADSLKRRAEMMERGALFEGRSRERILALGEAAALFSRLKPDDSRILHTAMGPVREKASPERLFSLLEQEKRNIRAVHAILHDAVREGDLQVDSEDRLLELALGAWGLVDGGFTLIEGGVAQQVLGVHDPYTKVWRAFNRMADAYGWKPFFNDWDYEESLASIRKAIFPVEAQELYGEGEWYGDHK